MSRLRNALLLGGVVTAGLGALNLALERRAGTIYNAVGGESQYYLWNKGDVFYAVKGTGRPVVLVHGINAAASSYEMRKNFEPLSQDFRVYALDLLGFGLSDRPPLVYTAETYVGLLGDFLGNVVREPADIVASSLSAAFAIAAAQRHPELVRRLVLVNPTGIDVLSADPGPAQLAFLQFLRSPVFGTAVFNAVASRASIAAFLKSQTFYDDSLVTEQMVDYYYDSAHQAGAKWAPASFLSGYLNIDIRWPWTQLRQPILLAWGQHSKITPLSGSEMFLKLNPEAKLQVFEKSSLVPHDEEAEEFNQMVKKALA